MKFISSQTKTLDHNSNTTWQCKKWWKQVSALLPQNSQNKFSSKGKQFLIERLSFIGIQSWSSFQEKVTTFGGAGLFTIDSNTLSFDWLKVASTSNDCSSNIYVDLTEKTPISSTFHHHLSSQTEALHSRITSFKSFSKFNSHTKSGLRHKKDQAPISSFAPHKLSTFASFWREIEKSRGKEVDFPPTCPSKNTYSLHSPPFSQHNY